MKKIYGKCNSSVEKADSFKWRRYNPKTTSGKLCYYICSKESDLPIRNAPQKKEPNYETGTYNCCASCNQRSISSALKRNFSHILFVTRYKGKLKKYRKKCFIVGFYKIGYTAKVPDKKRIQRDGIKAAQMCFVRIEHGHRLKKVKNLRNATQCILKKKLNPILKQLEKHNIVDEYKHEVKRLGDT